MVVLDLEWNRGYDKEPLNEILQIGAVRIDRLCGPVVDSFNACIRPLVHKKFDLGAKRLPERAAFKASRLTFPAAMMEFRAWVGGETQFACWGGGDVETLNESCKFWGVPPLEVGELFDFQQALSYVLGTDQHLALWRAVEYCGIPDVFDYHSALNDAMYTALIGGWLTWEALARLPEQALSRGCRTALKLSKLPFPQQPKQKIGPVQAVKSVLNARNGRIHACPLCGGKHGVARWHFAVPEGGDVPQQYYGVFACPEHGRFLCCLTVIRDEDGLWQGECSVPQPTEELAREYAAAVDGGVYVCKRAKRRRRKKSVQGAASGTGKADAGQRN